MSNPRGKLWNFFPFLIPLIIVGAVVSVIFLPVSIRHGAQESDLRTRPPLPNSSMPAIIVSKCNHSESPTTIFASDYSGYISTISLDVTQEGNYTLTKTASLKACGISPSWLTYHDNSKTLYCSDESLVGTLSAFKLTNDRQLNLVANVTTPGSNVHSTFYGGTNENPGFIVTAGYTGNITVFALPLTYRSEPLQIIKVEHNATGAVAEPNRQASSHIHQVILDPSGKYLIAPDLGGDFVHVFAVNHTSGKFTGLPILRAPPGCGPRHVAFRRTESMTHMYLACELSNQVVTYMINYGTDTILKFDQLGVVSVFGNNATPPEMTAGEIRVVDDDLYISIRSTKIKTSDSIAIFTFDEVSGLPKFVESTTTHGSYPRTFAISKDGTLVAIGNQKDGAVVVIGRDPETGQLSHDDFVALNVVANLTEGGLSSVVFA